MDKRRPLEEELTGRGDVPFRDLLVLAETFGFRVARVAGPHHILVHPRAPEILSLQEVAGKAKPYHIRRLLRTIERRGLRLQEENRGKAP